MTSVDTTHSIPTPYPWPCVHFNTTTTDYCSTTASPRASATPASAFHHHHLQQHQLHHSGTSTAHHHLSEPHLTHQISNMSHVHGSPVVCHANPFSPYGTPMPSLSSVSTRTSSLNSSFGDAAGEAIGVSASCLLPTSVMSADSQQQQQHQQQRDEQSRLLYAALPTSLSSILAPNSLKDFSLTSSSPSTTSTAASATSSSHHHPSIHATHNIPSSSSSSSTCSFTPAPSSMESGSSSCGASTVPALGVIESLSNATSGNRNTENNAHGYHGHARSSFNSSDVINPHGSLADPLLHHASTHQPNHIGSSNNNSISRSSGGVNDHKNSMMTSPSIDVTAASATTNISSASSLHHPHEPTPHRSQSSSDADHVTQ